MGYFMRIAILGDHDRMCELCRQIVPDGEDHQGSEELNAWKQDGLCSDCRNAFSDCPVSHPVSHVSSSSVVQGLPSAVTNVGEDSLRGEHGPRTQPCGEGYTHSNPGSSKG